MVRQRKAARRWLVGVLAMSALLSLGLSAPAGAEPVRGKAAKATASISGTVVYPAGFTYNPTDRPSLDAGPVDGVGPYGVATPSATGTFSIDGLEAGKAYRISLSGTQKLVWGTYTASGELTLGYLGAAAVTAPTSGITLRPQLATTIKGHVVFPTGYRYRADNAPIVMVFTTEGRLLPGVVGPRGWFTVPGMPVGASCKVQYADSDHRLETGYYTGGLRLTAGSSLAKWVTAPATGLLLQPRRLLVKTPVPTVTGTPAVGQILTGHPGTWGPGVNLMFQWMRGSAMIPGATKLTYRVTAADAGKQLHFVVRGAKLGYAPAIMWSHSVTVAP